MNPDEGGTSSESQELFDCAHSFKNQAFTEMAFHQLHISKSKQLIPSNGVILSVDPFFGSNSLEPNSGGVCSMSNSSATISETKKMGKFKFLTIPSANGGDTLPSPEPTSNGISPSHAPVFTINQEPQKTMSDTDDVYVEPPESSSASLTFSGGDENVPEELGEVSFGIPGPLSMPLPVVEVGRQLTDEDLINKHVQRLLKVTEIRDPINNADDEVEDEDDDFDSRLEQMIAADEQNRKRPGRRKAACRTTPRRSLRTKQLQNFDTVTPAVPFPEVSKATVPEPAIKLVTSTKPQKALKNARSSPAMVVNGCGKDGSDETSSQVSESTKEGEEQSEQQPRKPKSRWVESLASSVPPPVVIDTEAPALFIVPEPEQDILTVKMTSPEPGDAPEYYETITDCIRLSNHKVREDRDARKMRCDCQYSTEEYEMGLQGCMDGCLNRILYYECTKCSARDNCANKRFQRRDYAPLEVFQTKFKGFGIRTTAPLAAGQFICEYVGEVLDARQFRKRQKEYHKEERQHFYFMALNNDEVIDATRKGNKTRFTNHSCDPNSETQKWTVGGQLRIGFFTIRPVSAGEEITFDYQFERYGTTAQRCFCGASSCRGFIGSTGGEDKPAPGKPRGSGRPPVSEVDKFIQLGAIRTADHALKLARLLLRVESDSDRMTLLRVLQNSENNTEALKAFLRCQGLTLLADMMYSCKNSSSEMKLEILQTLPILPVMTKNSLMESDVWATLLKWAGRDVPREATISVLSSLQQIPRVPSESFSESPKDIPEKIMEVDSILAHDSETIVIKSEEKAPEWEIKETVEEPAVLVRKPRVSRFSEQYNSAKPTENPPVKDPEEEETLVTETFETTNTVIEVKREPTPDSVEAENVADVKSNLEEEQLIRELASSLLERWDTLKLIFKIPKKDPMREPPPVPMIVEDPKKPSPWKPSPSLPIPTVINRSRPRSPSPVFVPVKRPKFAPFPPYIRRPISGFRLPGAVPAQHPAPESQIDYDALTALMEQIRANAAMAAQQVSTRLLTNSISNNQKVTLMLPDNTLHDARTFKPIPEQAALLRSSLPEIGSPTWEQKAEVISSRTGLAVEAVEAPIVQEVVGWVANFDLSQNLYIPKDWAPAYDRVGRLYFYHLATGLSRWDFPSEERIYSKELQQISPSVTIPADEKNYTLVPASAVDLTAWTPVETEDESPEEKPMKPSGDSTNSGSSKGHEKESTADRTQSRREREKALKKRKIEFQNDLCQYIIQQLNVYRMPECTQGRIETKEDFKFLARKITHNVLEPELHRHRNHPEGLQFSNKHKPKIKEHIKKYMSRFGRTYRRNGGRRTGAHERKEDSVELDDDEEMEADEEQEDDGETPRMEGKHHDADDITPGEQPQELEYSLVFNEEMERRSSEAEVFAVPVGDASGSAKTSFILDDLVAEVEHSIQKEEQTSGELLRSSESC